MTAMIALSAPPATGPRGAQQPAGRDGDDGGFAGLLAAAHTDAAHTDAKHTDAKHTSADDTAATDATSANTVAAQAANTVATQAANTAAQTAAAAAQSVAAAGTKAPCAVASPVPPAIANSAATATITPAAVGGTRPTGSTDPGSTDTTGAVSTDAVSTGDVLTGTGHPAAQPVKPGRATAAPARAIDPVGAAGPTPQRLSGQADAGPAPAPPSTTTPLGQAAPVTPSSEHTARVEQVLQARQAPVVTASTTAPPRSIDLTLDPGELGAMHVSVAVHHGGLDVTIACADPATRSDVAAALPELHRELTAQVTGADTRNDTGAGPDQGGERPAPDDQPRERTDHDDNAGDGFQDWM